MILTYSSGITQKVSAFVTFLNLLKFLGLSFHLTNIDFGNKNRKRQKETSVPDAFFQMLNFTRTIVEISILLQKGKNLTDIL
jgi:hypothetical protein